MSVKMRQEVEGKIATALIEQILAAGFRISVSLERGYDTDEMLLGSTDKEAVLKEAMAGDDCHLFVHEATGELVDEDGRLDSIGWIYLVYGNDGWDAISDYTVNLEPHMTKAFEISKHYES